MDVDFIRYKGHKLPVKVGMYALGRFKADYGTSFFKVQEQIGSEEFDQFDMIPVYEVLIKHSLVNGAAEAEQELPEGMLEKVPFMLDEVLTDFIEIMKRQLEQVKGGSEEGNPPQPEQKRAPAKKKK